MWKCRLDVPRLWNLWISLEFSTFDLNQTFQKIIVFGQSKSGVKHKLRFRWLMNILMYPSDWKLQHTAVKRHCIDWYELWALTDHEIYHMKIELDLRKFSNGPFSVTEKGFGVGPTPGGSQCTGVSPTLSWKWPRATLSPSFGPFFERNRSFG